MLIERRLRVGSGYFWSCAEGDPTRLQYVATVAALIRHPLCKSHSMCPLHPTCPQPTNIGICSLVLAGLRFRVGLQRVESLLTDTPLSLSRSQADTPKVGRSRWAGHAAPLWRHTPRGPPWPFPLEACSVFAVHACVSPLLWNAARLVSSVRRLPRGWLPRQAQACCMCFHLEAAPNDIVSATFSNCS